jgi:hypothetical protein
MPKACTRNQSSQNIIENGLERRNCSRKKSTRGKDITIINRTHIQVYKNFNPNNEILLRSKQKVSTIYTENEHPIGIYASPQNIGFGTQSTVRVSSPNAITSLWCHPSFPSAGHRIM